MEGGNHPVAVFEYDADVADAWSYLDEFSQSVHDELGLVLVMKEEEGRRFGSFVVRTDVGEKKGID